MIPFRDNIPSRSFPLITVFIIVVNVLVFLYELALGPHLEPFLFRYGVVPAAVFAWAESHVPVSAVDVVVPFLTSMFLHGGWVHLFGSIWCLLFVGHVA